MACNTICTSCLRAMRMQARRDVLPVRHLNRLQGSQARRSFVLATRHSSASQSTSDPRAAIESRAPLTSPPPPPPITKSQRDAITSFAASVRNNDTFKSTTEPYVAYGSTEDLFRECTRQCNYTVPARVATPPTDPPRTAAGEDLGEGEGWWYTAKASGGLGLDVTFNTWAQVMFLHMYMLTVRLRGFPAQYSKIWHQNLLDHFFYAAEDRMVQWHAINTRGTRNKYLKDLWQQWRGVMLSYDEGLVRGDAVLAGAVWRNIFKANIETDINDVALVTAYLRHELQMLDGISDERLGVANVRFGDPDMVKRLVEQKSAAMNQTITAEELKLFQRKISTKAD